jgi:hypothetical protein
LDWKKGEAMVGSLALMPFCTIGCVPKMKRKSEPSPVQREVQQEPTFSGGGGGGEGRRAWPLKITGSRETGTATLRLSSTDLRRWANRSLLGLSSFPPPPPTAHRPPRTEVR